ncbi:MAG: hypothetical protein WBG71_01375 [Leeuwenhoekiella sp.]
MEMELAPKSQKDKQKVELVKGSFSKSEASFIIGALIDQKINFHKTQRLQIWEGDHQCKTGGLDGRISELQRQKKMAREYILGQDSSEVTFNIKGTLEITIEKNNS